MEGGREDKFFFSFWIEWQSRGTRHCGGRRNLTVFKLLCKKQNKTKKAACLIPLWKVGPLLDPWFSPGAGREEARAISLATSGGEH